jgi:hypothetical protein
MIIFRCSTVLTCTRSGGRAFEFEPECVLYLGTVVCNSGGDALFSWSFGGM